MTDHLANIRAEVEAGTLAPHRALDELQTRWQMTMKNIIREARAAGIWIADDPATVSDAEGHAEKPLKQTAPIEAKKDLDNRSRAYAPAPRHKRR